MAGLMPYPGVVMARANRKFQRFVGIEFSVEKAVYLDQDTRYKNTDFSSGRADTVAMCIFIARNAPSLFFVF